MKKVGYILIGLLLLSSFSIIATGASDGAMPWWDFGYGNRQQVTINNLAASELEDGYTVKISIDHASLVSAGKSLASGDDIRVVYWDGASNVELDRISENWNTAITEILFKTKTSVTPGGSDSNYYVYYGNQGAGSPPANAGNVYLVFDDFESYPKGVFLNGSGGWQVFTTPATNITIVENERGFGKALKLQDDYDGSDCPNRSDICRFQPNIKRSVPSGDVALEFKFSNSDLRNGIYASNRALDFRLEEKASDSVDPAHAVHAGSFGNWPSWEVHYKDYWYSYSPILPWTQNEIITTKLWVWSAGSTAKHTIDVNGNTRNNYESGPVGDFAGNTSKINYLRFSISTDQGKAISYLDDIKLRKYINPEPAASLGPEDTPQIWSCDGTLTNEGETQITSDPGWDYDPSFSPDGSKILFTYVAPSGGDTDIIVMNTDGTNRIQLTYDPDNTNDDYPAWNPDGSRIVYSSGVYGVNSMDIYTMNADGSEKQCLTCQDDGNWRNPKWSPNGNTIAYLNDKGPYLWDIWVMNADGSGKKLLVGGSNYAFPSWSPDGSRILYTQGPGAYGDIWMMNADGSSQTQLTNTPWNEAVPVFSPDGKRIGYQSEKSGNWDIWVMNADGSEQTPLTDYPTLESHGHGGTLWSPDGSKILFISNRMGTYDLFVMTLGCEGRPTIMCGGTSAPWWDFNYGYRQKITLNNPASSILEEGYTVKTNLDHSTKVSAGMALGSGDDVRIVYWDGASNTELDRISDDWNSVNTEILFKTQASIPAGGSDSNYYLYYGNTDAINPLGDRKNVYLFYDDFNSYTSINDPSFLSNWERFNNQGVSSIENGVLRMQSTAVCCNGQKWLTKQMFDKNINVKYIVKNNMVQDFYRPRLITTFLRAERKFGTYGESLPNLHIACCPGGSTILYADSYVNVGDYDYSNAFHSIEVIAFDDNMSLYRDGSYLGSVDLSNHMRDGAFGFYVHGDVVGADDVSFDNVEIRKIISPEPTTVSCTEESREGIPPTTTIGLSGIHGNDGWFTSDVEVILTAIDNDQGSGIKKIEFSFDGSNWNAYSAPFILGVERSSTIYYRSIDNAGNIEAAKEQAIKIDKTPPETTLILGDAPWYSDYKYRQKVSVENLASTDIEAGYTTRITLDHSTLVSASKSLASGDDVRVVFWDGASNKELDRISENWNTVNTEILFKTQASIPTGNSDSNYYVYYGNPSVSNPPDNPSGVYIFEGKNTFSEVTTPKYPMITIPQSTSGSSYIIDSEDVWYQTVPGSYVTPPGSSEQLVSWRADLMNVTPGANFYAEIDYNSGHVGQYSENNLLIISQTPDIRLYDEWKGNFIRISRHCCDRGNFAHVRAWENDTAIGEPGKIKDNFPYFGTIVYDFPLDARLRVLKTGSNWWKFDYSLDDGNSWQNFYEGAIGTYSETSEWYVGMGVECGYFATCFGSWSKTNYIDIKSRKYISPEPATSLGLEEVAIISGGGWFASDVSVALSAMDDLSGVAATYYRIDGSPYQEGTAFVITSDGVHSVSYYSIDNAGNVEEAKAQVVKVDKTPPTIRGAATTPPNADDWYNTDVTVRFVCEDEVAGPVESSFDVFLNIEGTDRSASGTCTDNAGNSASAIVQGINIDKTAPNITGSRSPQANANGWNNEDVTLFFECNDGLSGVETCTGDGKITAEGSSQSVAGTATDLAGNSATATVSDINIDKTAPSISGAPITQPNANGWYNSDVVIHFTADDALSEIATVTPDTTLTAEGADQSVSGTATDKAGNSASATVGNINIDKIVPSITGAPTTQPNVNGWYNSDVVVHFTVSDELSGLDSVTPDTTLTAEGTAQSVTGAATDKAGNSASETISGINIDKTMPIATITSPEAKVYLHSESISISFDSDDALSGVDSTAASIDGMQVTNGQVLDLKTLTLGQHTLTVEVTDKAGNTESETVTFNIKPLSATVDVKPDTLNKDSQSDKNAVTVYIEIPGYDVNAIDLVTVTMSTSKGTINAQLTPTEVGDYDKDGMHDRMVKFERQQVIDIVDVGDNVEITISGRVTGAIFVGSDSIRVINKGK